MMKNLISMLIILGIFPYVNMANEKKAEFQENEFSIF